MILNDYPPDIRARYGPMRPETRLRAGYIRLPLLVMGAVIKGIAMRIEAVL